MKRTLLLLVPLALSGCMASTMPPPPPLLVITAGAAATIGFGGQAMLNGISIRPLVVIEDSRCPINARCIWAGRLILRAAVAAGGAPEQRDFTLGVPLATPGGTLTLVSAEPGKLAGAEGNPPASRFTFELTR